MQRRLWQVTVAPAPGGSIAPDVRAPGSGAVPGNGAARLPQGLFSGAASGGGAAVPAVPCGVAGGWKSGP